MVQRDLIIAGVAGLLGIVVGTFVALPPPPPSEPPAEPVRIRIAVPTAQEQACAAHLSELQTALADVEAKLHTAEALDRVHRTRATHAGTPP